MHMIFPRRHFLQLAGLGLISGCVSPTATIDVAQQLADLERSAGGKLGVTMLIPSSGQSVSHRGDERFGMASSFKLALAAIVLREADQGRLSLETEIPINRADLVSHAPMVTENLSRGKMTIKALAEAAQTTSDNAATNLLLKQIGGLGAFNAHMLELGDATTRLDRYEPLMNLVAAGDPRDTTTPNAMAASIGKILSTDWLRPSSQALLIDWMVATQTGLKRIRAGLPRGWKAGDKTGSSFNEEAQYPDRYNDIAAIWPPGRPMMIVAAYYESPVKSETMRDADMAVLAKVGAIASQWAMSQN